MSAADDLMWIASVLEHGDAPAHTQKTASRALQRIATQARRMERTLDEIVSASQTEAHLLAQSERALVPLRTRPRFRLVSR